MLSVSVCAVCLCIDSMHNKCQTLNQAIYVRKIVEYFTCIRCTYLCGKYLYMKTKNFSVFCRELCALLPIVVLHTRILMFSSPLSSSDFAINKFIAHEWTLNNADIYQSSFMFMFVSYDVPWIHQSYDLFGTNNSFLILWYGHVHTRELWFPVATNKTRQSTWVNYMLLIFHRVSSVV